ncbi:MAG: 4Fe-4S dicluster domain-containing protein [Candidatus Helarchaeales archaeon]
MTEQEIDVYEKMRRTISNWPIRAPKSKYVKKIFELIFTPEEAEIISFFNQPLVDRVSPKKFVKRVLQKTDKYTEEQIIEILENLSKRGMIYKRMKITDTGKQLVRYSAWPMVIGIFEWFFSKAGMNDGTYSEETIKKVTQYFERYAYEGFMLEIGPSNYPWARILPADQANKIVEVNEELGIDKPVVLTFEQVKTAIENANGIGVIPCACRTEGKYSKIHPPCDNPIDVCMVLDDIDYFEHAGLLIKRITKEEALEILKKCEKKGLVHCTSNAQEMNFICNCCSCHCGILRGYTEMHNPRAFMKSNYIATFNENECKECYRCVEICPTKAIHHYMARKNEKKEERWEVNPERCIGCGVCASNCPANKIDLKKVRNEIPEETLAECYMRMERERVW